MDPLVALPPEVLRMVCALLPPADLATLAELSRGWRDFAADETVWPALSLGKWDFTFTERTPRDLRVLLRAPCIDLLELPHPWGGVFSQFFLIDPKLVDALSNNIKKVRRVKNACCALDVVLPLLRRVAPHLEELQISDAKVEHLEAISGMPALRALTIHIDSDLLPPRFQVPALPPQLQELFLVHTLLRQHLRSLVTLAALRKLGIEGIIPANVTLGLPQQLEELWLLSATQAGLQVVQSAPALRRLFVRTPWHSEDGYVFGDAVEFPPLPPGHCGLRWLRFEGQQCPSAAATMLSLIRAHAATLEELVVRNDDSWKRSSEDPAALAGKLEACGLGALRLLQLKRYRSCEKGRCGAQLHALRLIFADLGTVVECRDCREEKPANDGWGVSSDHSDDSDDEGDFEWPESDSDTD